MHRNAKIRYTHQANTSCPIHIQPYIIRYLHEHKLYTARKCTFAAIGKFRDDLMAHLNIPYTADNDTQVYERCKSCITAYTKTWIKWGLLVKKRELVVRSPLFDKALEARRVQWMNYHNKDWSATSTGEFCSVRNSSCQPQGRKRVSNRSQNGFKLYLTIN